MEMSPMDRAGALEADDDVGFVCARSCMFSIAPFFIFAIWYVIVGAD